MTVNDFMDTMMSDPGPPCLVWLPLLHRLASVETGTSFFIAYSSETCSFTLRTDCKLTLLDSSTVLSIESFLHEDGPG